MLRVGQNQADAENELTKRLSSVIIKKLETNLKKTSKLGNTKEIQKIIQEIKKIKGM